MFVVRCVDGDHKGKYYAGLDTSGYLPEPIWTTQLDEAEHLDVNNTAGIIVAMIDTRCIVAAPERVDATEENCQTLAETLANDMFQSPGEAMFSVIKRAIRENADAPIYDRPPEMTRTKEDEGYMSVWEWVGVAMATNNKREET